VERWVILLAATAAVWMAIAWLGWQAAPGDLPALERAEFVASAGETIPAETAEWQPVSLPDDWKDHRRAAPVPPYSSAVALAGMGWVLLRRFVGALRESQALVATLEGRVREKRAALDESYARIREAERARVLAEERERIMREMHDGLGSQLVSTLAMIEGNGTHHEAIGPAVRAALDDLRLMVDSLEPVEGDLVAALAMLRARLQPRLEAAGLEIEWRVGELPALPDLGPEKILQVLRILQEVFTNVVRHARARRITVRTGEETAPEQAVFVEVADDGRGMPPGGPTGRGLKKCAGGPRRSAPRSRSRAPQMARGSDSRCAPPSTPPHPRMSDRGEQGGRPIAAGSRSESVVGVPKPYRPDSWPQA
jgi:signal transduction histidine kinase